MARCVQDRCGTRIEDDWAFCPYCGGDNRPPKARQGVAGCSHDFADGYYCCRCGLAGDQAKAVVGPLEEEPPEVLEDAERPRNLSIVMWLCLLISLPLLGPSRLLFLLFNPSYYRLPEAGEGEMAKVVHGMLEVVNETVLFNIWATAIAAMVFFLGALFCSALLWRVDEQSAKTQAIVLWVVAAGLIIYSVINLVI